MKKQPKLMNLPRIRDIVKPHEREISRWIYLDSHIVIARDFKHLLPLIIRQQPPFSIDDRRLGIIISGEARVNINLVDKHYTPGSLVYIGPGSIISPISYTDDIKLCGFGVPADFPLPFTPGQLPQAFNGQVRDFLIPATQTDIATARHILATMWHIVHQPDYNLHSVAHLIAAQMYHYDTLFHRLADSRQSTQPRELNIFDRFIYLVNQHAQSEHQIGFYARKMCLSERYLSTVIRQASGVTAKEWIDRAIITRIKVELRHSQKSIAQIAEMMNFPNPSFFSKYFKRLTGLTPAQFREL